MVEGVGTRLTPSSSYASGSGAIGSARALGARGWGFKSLLPDLD